jgi:hypothetical protein
VGPSQCPPSSGPAQGAASQFRLRHCLLKGCERLFRPMHYQDRYCGAACRLQAERWRRWHSTRTYRASESGKQCRRVQSRRYRERGRQRRVARWEQMLRDIEVQVAREAEEAAAVFAAQLEAAEPREGQRTAPHLQDFSGQPCQRPGCYVLLSMQPGVAQQRFCSCQCRQALRCVLDRESRWRWRQRRRRRRCRPSRPPPL